jgi:hypothetical protein
MIVSNQSGQIGILREPCNLFRVVPSSDSSCVPNHLCGQHHIFMWSSRERRLFWNRLESKKILPANTNKTWERALISRFSHRLGNNIR